MTERLDLPPLSPAEEEEKLARAYTEDARYWRHQDDLARHAPAPGEGPDLGVIGWRHEPRLGGGYDQFPIFAEQERKAA